MSAPTCVIRREQLAGDEQDRYACLRCTEGIRRHLREIESYQQVVQLMPTLLAIPGRADLGRRFPGHGSKPPPGLLASLDALDPRAMADLGEDGHKPILWRLESVCRLVLEERTDAGATEDGETYSATPQGTITYLLWTAEWCAHQPWVDDHASGIAEIHAQVRGLAHDGPGPPLAPCLLVGCGGQVRWCKDVRDPANPALTVDAARCNRCSRVYTGLDLIRLRIQEVG